MNGVIVYAPLTEAITTTGDSRFKACSVEEFTRIQAENETIYFDISKTYCRSERIKEWREADPEDVAIEHETSEFNTAQRRVFEASKRTFLEFFG